MQVVLGVPYNILKFEVDRMNTLGNMGIQSLAFSENRMPDFKFTPFSKFRLCSQQFCKI